MKQKVRLNFLSGGNLANHLTAVGNEWIVLLRKQSYDMRYTS